MGTEACVRFRQGVSVTEQRMTVLAPPEIGEQRSILAHGLE
jgi:hypothetical protein